MDTGTEHATATLQDVRLALFRQHTQLSQLLDELESHAKGVLAGNDCAGSLSDAIILLHRRFVRHLDFEETRLEPLLDTAPNKEGAALVRAALADHADQRARIDGLLHDRMVFTDPKSVAREAMAFVHTIRVDMVEEDAGLRALG